MSNRVYENEMYNKEIKENFLNNYRKDTQLVYKRIFLKSAKLEKSLDKDLYNFTTDQLEDVLRDLNPSTLTASRSNASIIIKYLDWSGENGLRSNINPLKVFPPKYFDKFVNASIQLYVTDEQLRDIEDFCVNAQDAVIFRLLFEGVGGRECSELRNLRKKDINFDEKVLTLYNDKNGHKEKRELSVSSRCIGLIEEALKQDTYAKRNGELIEDTRVRQFNNLVQNDYVIRNSITRTDNYGAVSVHTIYRRIDVIRELFGDLPYLTAKGLTYSGMLAMAKELLEEEGKLEKRQLLKICKRYNFNKETWYLLKKHINVENIEKVYN